MIVRIAVLVMLACLSIVVARHVRRRRRFARQEDILHEIHLRSKRRDWLGRWARKDKLKQLTYRIGDAETRDGNA